jgi:tRNA A37 threonylcarbamoyladenosine biosynthesis protein TsaE
MGTTICRGIFHNFGVANVVRISTFLLCQNYNIMKTQTMIIAMGNIK